jgi:hypothetical protein
MVSCQRGFFIGAVVTLAAIAACSISKTPDGDAATSKDVGTSPDYGTTTDTAPDTATPTDMGGGNDMAGGMDTPGGSDVAASDMMLIDTPGPEAGGDSGTAACAFAFCEDFESDKSGSPPGADFPSTGYSADCFPTPPSFCAPGPDELFLRVDGRIVYTCTGEVGIVGFMRRAPGTLDRFSC